VEALPQPLDEDVGTSVRLDIVRPCLVEDDNSDSYYTMLFESAYLQFESSYHGIAFPEENIQECLSAANLLYEADRAYVLEIDEELDAGQYLYLKLRDGLSPKDDDVTDDILFSCLFNDIIKKGQPFFFHTEDFRDSHPDEYAWLCRHEIFNAMGVPFTTRAEELNAFFCVNNVRRFWNKTSFLNLSTKALSNEYRAIHMFRPQGTKYASSSLSNEEIVIRLFGGFEITTSDGILDLSDYSSVQCNRLLLYLIKNKNRTIPIREITDVLWPDQLIDNPYNMVKGIAFRVRKILDSIGLGKLLVAKSGTYTINDQISIYLDIDYFDRLCEQIHSAKLSVLEKQYLYEKAIRLYKGDMLPNYESEIWLIGWIGYYQIKYLSILKEYMTLLKDTEQYDKIFEVFSGAQNIACSEGDVYDILMEALIKQNKLEMAKSYYIRVEKFLSADQKKKFLDLWNEYKNL
jgi:two-component SAPR family response regulator